ncbi:MAG: CoB--CoM heterodisulfide reductase iron-sulfur subunit B family protein [Peptococcaceae bacterium]|nr:CoB--CoM heterodisulfide reductase iron-sulfur subunit B family protein [Peptococcaceae bacterium]
MKYAYYPGCSLSGTGLEYNISTQAVAPLLGIELCELPDWSCCGASSAHLQDHTLALALPARNAALGEEQGLSLAIPCAACLSRSKAAEHAVKTSEDMRAQIESLIDRPYQATYPVKSILEIFIDAGLDTLKENIIKPLTGLKVASYYGCLQARPTDFMDVDDPENPQTIDTIVAALGAEPVSWSHKTECCGNSHPIAYPEVGGPLVNRILEQAEKSGADCIVCACPMCLGNLDMRQKALGKKRGRPFNLPVFYFTQLMGLALNLRPKKLGLKKHFISPIPLLSKKDLLKRIKIKKVKNKPADTPVPASESTETPTPNPDNKKGGPA